MSAPQCEKCGGRTYLTRREPHQTMEQHREIQTFRCASCEHQQVKDVDLSSAAAK